MTSTTPRSTVTRQRVFGRGSPVLEYWLGHSEGFALTTAGGSSRGVVEEVVIDEYGHARALVVRSAVLQRAQVLDVSSVEAVVPSDRTITVRGARHRRPSLVVTLSVARLARETAAIAGRAAVREVPFVRRAISIVARAAWTSLMLVVSATRWGGRQARRYAPVVARRAGRAIVTATAWARPHARTLARQIAAAAVTGMLFLVTLAQALVVATAASARLVAREWRQRRAASRRGRMNAAGGNGDGS
jgi:hypothetical protein